MSPHAEVPTGSRSKLFTPLTIGNGSLTLSHRIVLAPLTRKRGIPLNPAPTDKSPPSRTWLPDALITKYYVQRTTPGGLLITEAIPPSIEAGATPGGPGLFCTEQVAGWKDVVDAVHAKGGFIYAQLWHAGRATIPQFTGMPTVSASATPYGNDEVFSHPPPGSTELVKYRDFPPSELSVGGIKRVIAEYVASASMAVDQCGFDGVEVHGGNGYLPEQFLSSNINKRTDEYGGTPEKRGRFVVELMEALKDAVGEDRLAIRLSPFGLYNDARGEARVETWGSLCRELKKRMNLSYVHFIEPRYEQVFSAEEKKKFLETWNLPDVDLSLFRKIFGTTPLLSAGGWNDMNCWGVVESGAVDALAIGRYFLSTPDFVERLKNGFPMNSYDRSRFYGPFEDREVGFTDYPTWDEVQGKVKTVIS